MYVVKTTDSASFFRTREKKVGVNVRPARTSVRSTYVSKYNTLNLHVKPTFDIAFFFILSSSN